MFLSLEISEPNPTLVAAAPKVVEAVAVLNPRFLAKYSIDADDVTVTVSCIDAITGDTLDDGANVMTAFRSGDNEAHILSGPVTLPATLAGSPRVLWVAEVSSDIAKGDNATGAAIDHNDIAPYVVPGQVTDHA